jgi:hypothetical protein
MDADRSKSKNRKMPVCAALMSVQCAALTGQTEVIAELMWSSHRKDLDTVRFLLQRGASADHFCNGGYGAGVLCWEAGDDMTTHSSLDVFNLLAEDSYLEMDELLNHPFQMLAFAAVNACGVQIDALARLVSDVHCNETTESDARYVAILTAARHGNHSAYLALVSYYDENVFRDYIEFASKLLFETIIGRLFFLNNPSAFDGRHSEHDEVITDMFQRGVGPRARLRVSDSNETWRPPGIHDEEFEADKLAAALGPATEAWYLGLLHHCGLLAHEELQRLRELAETGHVAAGFVYEIAEERDEVNDSGLGQKDIYTDIDGVSRRSSVSEADEANQFWDAEEVL